MRNTKFSDSIYLNQQKQSNTENLINLNCNAKYGVGLQSENDGFHYGYVFFRQQKDDEVRRGFFQKSLVLITPHPWHGMFLKIVMILGPVVMNSLVVDRRGRSSCKESVAAIALMEAACFNIAAWPQLPSSASYGSRFSTSKLSLAFLGNVENFVIPQTARFPQLFDHQRTRQYSGFLVTPKYSPCNPGNFYQLFSKSIEHLWQCWEIMITGEPILVIADSPNASSQCVWALVELIKPVI